MLSDKWPDSHIYMTPDGKYMCSDECEQPLDMEPVATIEEARTKLEEYELWLSSQMTLN